MGWFSKSTDGFFLSTTTPPDIPRSQYLGVVNGEAIIGANIFRDMFSSVRDVVGGRAGGYERALSGARDAALEGLTEAAKLIELIQQRHPRPLVDPVTHTGFALEHIIDLINQRQGHLRGAVQLKARTRQQALVIPFQAIGIEQAVAIGLAADGLGNHPGTHGCGVHTMAPK